MKKLTQQEYITKAIAVHGDKYDYSKLIYVNRRTEVYIICPKHGGFWQKAGDHLCGKGCMKCGIEKNTALRKNKVALSRRTIKFGVGVNDYEHPVVDCNGKIIISYQKWISMLIRCYDKKYHEKEPSYVDCSVCEQWKRFSNFKKWFDKNYIEGSELDKDVLVKGNKIYSPQTCCFIPKKLNAILTNSKKKRNYYPVGVTITNHNRFMANCSDGDKRHYLGVYKTPQEAFEAYRKKKKEIIEREARKYYETGVITREVYDALLNYRIEITD